MARKALRPCPRCRSKLIRTERYCDDCGGDTGWADTQAGRSRHDRGYGRAWERVRKSVLERDKYLCQPCAQDGRSTPCNIVDHVVPKSEGGTDNPSNLQAICKPCHDAKTLEEARRGKGRGGRIPGANRQGTGAGDNFLC